MHNVGDEAGKRSSRVEICGIDGKERIAEQTLWRLLTFLVLARQKDQTRERELTSFLLTFGGFLVWQVRW